MIPFLPLLKIYCESVIIVGVVYAIVIVLAVILTWRE